MIVIVGVDVIIITTVKRTSLKFSMKSNLLIYFVNSLFIMILVEIFIEVVVEQKDFTAFQQMDPHYVAISRVKGDICQVSTLPMKIVNCLVMVSCEPNSHTF